MTTVVPEADFLGELEAANEKVSIGLILLVLLVAVLAASSANSVASNASNWTASVIVPHG